MPPEKSSEIESEGTFNGLLLLLFQDSMHIAKPLMYIWLNSTKSIARGSGRLYYLNLKGTILDMNHD